MGSIDNNGRHYGKYTVDRLNTEQSEAIISAIVYQCKRTIMHFMGKEAQKIKSSYSMSSNQEKLELENIAGDFKDRDLANLYVEYLTRQKLYSTKAFKEGSKRVAMSRSRENMTHLLQLLKEEIAKRKSKKARSLKISDPDTRDLMQWLEDLPSTMPEKSAPPQRQEDLSADDLQAFELVIMLYEWGRKVILNLLSSMMTSSESEMVVAFGRMFDFLSHILAFLPEMSDQMNRRLSQASEEESARFQ